MPNKDEMLTECVQAYLKDGKLLYLATFVNTTPWVCHVWYSLGWMPNSVVFTSNLGRRHSSDIRVNPIVAGGIVAIETEGLGQKVRGLSFEGRAFEATENKLALAYDAYASRWPKVRDMFSLKDVESGVSAMRMYVVEFSRMVLFDEVNFPDGPRQELLL